MKKKPEGQSPGELPPRLEFKEPEGWYRYGRIPYKIYYSTNNEGKELVDERNPGSFGVTPDLPGPGDSLSIWIHESVPKEFKDIVMFHELTEAELVLANGIDHKEAHRRSVAATEQYARTNLSQKEFDEFQIWLKSLDNY